MKTFYILMAVVLLGVPAQARSLRESLPKFNPVALTACPRVDPTNVGATQAYADGMSSGKCYVSINSMLSSDMIYRSYVVFSDGLLMVFNSYGDGDDRNPNLTSAREFYFLPRTGALKLAADERAGTLSVVMSDGGRAHIEPASGQIKSLERGTVTVSPRIDPVDRGGVEIPNYAGLMLDAGFRMGASPSARPDAESTFRDAHGHLCTVKNREIFAYAGGEHALKFTDAQLSAWLKTRCPAISAGF